MGSSAAPPLPPGACFVARCAFMAASRAACDGAKIGVVDERDFSARRVTTFDRRWGGAVSLSLMFLVSETRRALGAGASGFTRGSLLPAALSRIVATEAPQQL